MTALTPYISLSSPSPVFTYEPFRDGWYGYEGDPAGGWRASFSNVISWPNPGLNNVGTGVPLRETYLDGANVTVQFEGEFVYLADRHYVQAHTARSGTAVYLCLTPTSASFTFTIDGNPMSTTGLSSDPACAETGAEQMAYADGLPGVVTVGLNGTNPTTTHLVDDDVGWSYQPGGAWTFSNVSAPSGNLSQSWTCSYGPSYTASYTFNGSSAVQLLGLLNLNIGPYTIQFDGQSYTYNGSDLWRETEQVMFFKAGLDASKEYTITYINYDQAAPDAQQPVGPDYYPCASVQGLLLAKVTPGPPPKSGAGSGDNTSGSGPVTSTPVGAIVDGVVGGIAAVCIIVLILWCFCRRRRHAASALLEIDPDPIFVHPEATPYILPPQPAQISTNSAQRLEDPQVTGYPSPGITTLFSSPVTSQPSGSDEKRRLGRSPMERMALLTNSSVLPPSMASVSPLQPSTNASPNPSDMNVASTQELVGILNQRLRAQFRTKNDLDLPEYEAVN
ncbi:hypothetical protein DACRYDRAFT_112426 [Dacryopinax primogenitus]|uniref:Uncharacterized protein n=1 Tax=Dacryopinax primogenitus (strain DJM 731) TaxID=1858805 RepID=M5FQ86_DACPD|nr:uncharacterized protein DACRYDRAFT_112426 [Dacryopinax primogenitus]EJT96809.1 hypothetical protein DACRYDRAFT_112426 [Dacryopinax primogenitus]